MRLEETGTASLPGDTTAYETLKMTFGPSVGDTPNDYYPLFIHPETHVLAGCEYIVT